MTDQLWTLTGTIGTREQLEVPPGAVATVKVVDTDGEVLAATAVEADVLPVAWSVAVDPSLVADAGRLLIWAALRTEAGWWGTLDLVPATETDVLLSRIPD